MEKNLWMRYGHIPQLFDTSHIPLIFNKFLFYFLIFSSLYIRIYISLNNSFKSSCIFKWKTEYQETFHYFIHIKKHTYHFAHNYSSWAYTDRPILFSVLKIGLFFFLRRHTVVVETLIVFAFKSKLYCEPRSNQHTLLEIIRLKKKL